jgi:DNA primase
LKYKVISDNIDVLKLLEVLKIEGKVIGDDFMASCPVNPDHEDKNPSWGIRIEGDAKGVWHCYGCGMKGNAIHLVMSIKGVSREEAEKLLCEWFDIQDITPDISVQEILKMMDRKEAVEEEEILIIPLPRLSDSKIEAVRYLMAKRRYTELEAWDIINAYQIGFCEKGYYKGRIIIPIYDSAGVYITYEAQATDGNGKKKLYPKGSMISRLVFNDYNISEKRAVIVEGIWDALRLRSYGIPAISIFGSSLSKHQACRVIRKYEEVVLFFDGDKAGQGAEEKAVQALFPYVKVRSISIEGKDPDDLNREEVSNLKIFG